MVLFYQLLKMDYFFSRSRGKFIQLKSYLEDINLNNSNATLIIEADKKSEHSMLVDVWEIAQQAGIKKITIATGLKAKDD